MSRIANWCPQPFEPKKPRIRVAPAEERVYNGVTYASKLEAEYAAQLDLRKKAGEVAWWTRQVPFWLTPDDKYVADFLVIRTHKWVLRYYCTDEPPPEWIEAVEVKGWHDSRSKKIIQRWRRCGPIPLRIVRKGEPDQVVAGGGQ